MILLLILLLILKRKIIEIITGVWGKKKRGKKGGLLEFAK